MVAVVVAVVVRLGGCSDTVGTRDAVKREKVKKGEKLGKKTVVWVAGRHGGNGVLLQKRTGA